MPGKVKIPSKVQVPSVSPHEKRGGPASEWTSLPCSPGLLKHFFGEPLEKVELEETVIPQIIEAWSSFLSHTTHNAESLLQDFKEVEESRRLSPADLMPRIYKGLEKRGRYCLSLGCQEGNQRLSACAILEKGKNGRVYVHMVNAWGGEDLHPLVGLVGEKRKRSYRYYPIRLKSNDFFKPKGKGEAAALRLLHTVRIDAVNSKEEFQTIYQLFAQVGTVCRGEEVLDPRLGVKVKAGGGNVEQLFSLLLKETLGNTPHAYKKSMLAFKYGLLRGAFESLQGTASPDDIKLLSICKRQFAVRLAKGGEEGWLSVEERRKGLELCDAIDCHQREETPASEAIFSPHQVILPKTIDASFRKIKGAEAAYDPKLVKEKPPEGCQPPLFDKVFTPETLLTDLGHFLQWLNKEKKNVTKASALQIAFESTTHLLERLPLPVDEAGKAFWNAIPEKDLAKTVEVLTDVVYTGMKKIESSQAILPHYKEVVLASMSAYAITEYVCRRIPELKLEGFNTAPPFFYEADHVSFPFVWQQDRYERLRSYFKSCSSSTPHLFYFAGSHCHQLKQAFAEWRDKKREVKDYQEFYSLFDYVSQFIKDQEGDEELLLQHYMRYIAEKIIKQEIDGYTFDEIHDLTPSKQLEEWKRRLGEKKFETARSHCESKREIKLLHREEFSGLHESSFYRLEALYVSCSSLNKGAVRGYPALFEKRPSLVLGYEKAHKKIAERSYSLRLDEEAYYQLALDKEEIRVKEEKRADHYDVDAHYSGALWKASRPGDSLASTPSVNNPILFGKLEKIVPVTENQDLLQFPKDLPFSHEVFQALCMLKDFPKRRGGGLLQFIELHPDAASLADVQAAIEYLLFEPGFLSQMAEKNPRFIEELRTVLDGQVKRYAHPHEYEKSLGWIRLAYKLETHASKNQDPVTYVKRREELDGSILHIQKEMALLQAKDPSFAPQALYLCILCRLFLQVEEPCQFVPKQAGKLYGLWIALKMQDRGEIAPEDETCLVVERYMHKHYEEFFSSLKGDEFEAGFYTQLGEYFQGIQGKKGLNGKEGHYSSSCGRYAFDFFLGLCYEGGVLVQKGEWPAELLPSAKEIFPGVLPTVRKIAGGVEGTTQPFRLRKGERGEILYERKIDPSSSAYWKLLTDKEVWETRFPFFLVEDKQCWISSQGDIWVTDKQNQPEYQFHHARKIIKRVADGKILFDSTDSSLTGLIGNIWKSSQVLLWGTGEQPDELVFPYLDHLSFSLEQKNGCLRITSPHYHGYVMAQDQACPELGGMEGALVLEKEDEPEKRVLLLPCQHLTSSHSLTPSPPVAKHVLLAPSKTDKTRVFAYEVEELRGALRPIYGDRTAAKLYLIDIFLREKDYDKADFYIEDLFLDRPFSQADRIILDDLIQNAPLDPIGSSLIIRLFTHLIQDKVFFKQREEIQKIRLEKGKILEHFHMAMTAESLRDAGDTSKDWRLSQEEKESILIYLRQKSLASEGELEKWWNLLHCRSIQTAAKVVEFLPGVFSQEALFLKTTDAFVPKIPEKEKKNSEESKPADKSEEVPLLEKGAASSPPASGCRLSATEETFTQDFSLLYRLAKNARNEHPPEFDLAIVPYLSVTWSEPLKPYFELLLRVRNNPTRFPEMIDPRFSSDIDGVNQLLKTPAKPLLVKPPVKTIPYRLSSGSSAKPSKEKIRIVEVLKGKQLYQAGERPLGVLADLYFSKEDNRFLVDPGTPFPLVARPHTSEMVQAQLRALEKAHQENMKKPIQVFSSKKEQPKLPLKSALEGKQTELKDSYIQLKAEIERLANQRGVKGGEEKQLKFHAKALPGLTLETGIFEAILAQDAHYLQKFNPLLDDAQAQEIYDKTLRYMLLRSEYDQVTSALEACTSGDLKGCAVILNRTRKYSPSEHPLLLAYEYVTGNMFREEPDQTALLLKIFSVVFEEEPSEEKQEKLRRLFFEFQAGGGKTKVVAAILAAVAIHRGKMPVFVSLPEIYDVAKEDFRDTLERVYRKKVDAIDLHLGSNPSLKELRSFYRQCRQGLKGKRGQIMTPESYHVLILSFERALEAGEEKKIEALRKILRFYKKHAIFLIDESHRNVDSLLQANLALGIPVPLSEKQQQLFLKVYDLLMEIPQLKLKENEQALVNDTTKTKAIKALASSVLMSWGVHYYSNLLDCVTQLEVDPSLIDNDRYKERAEELYLLRGLCTEILPHALSQVEGMDHGPSIHSNTPLDGPRRFKSPSKAQFESADVGAALTIQGYYQRGIQTYEDRRQLIERMQQEFIAGRQAVTDFRVLPVYQDFLTWQEGVDDALKISLDRVDERFLNDRQAVMKLGDKIDKNPNVIRYFLENFVLPRVVIFPYKYTSTAQELAAGAFSTVLFSATLGPKEQNPFVETEEQFDEDLRFQAHVIQRATMPHNENVNWVEDKGPCALLEELYQKDPSAFINPETLINLGGFAKHASNEEWAKVWLEFVKKKGLICKGVLFKQEEPAEKGEIGEKVFYFWKEGEAAPERLSTTDIPQELRQRGLATHEVVKIYGPDDTTGTDMPLSQKAKMIVTIGEGTTSTALIQAIMRARPFLKAPFDPEDSQSLIWVGTTSLKKKIEEVIREEVKGTQEIFLWALEQQAKREKVAILANAYQEIRGIYRQFVLEKITNKGMSAAEVSREFNERYRSLFREDLGRNLKALYGSPLCEVDVGKTLEKFAGELAKNYSLSNALSKSRIATVISRAKEKVGKVKLASRTNLSNTAQQQQVNVSIQMKVAQTEKQQVAAIPFDKTFDKTERDYAKDELALTTQAFWRGDGCKEISFPCSLHIMPNANYFEYRDRYIKPPGRLLLTGIQENGKWNYRCYLVSLGDATIYEEQMRKLPPNSTRKIALLNLTGRLECNATHIPFSPEELQKIRSSKGFQQILTYVHLRNGKVYQENVLKKMIRKNFREMQELWKTLKENILDTNRVQTLLIERLFNESASASLQFVAEIAVEEEKKVPEEDISSFSFPAADALDSLNSMDQVRAKGMKRMEAKEHYVARKIQDFFFRRGLFRFLNKWTWGLVGYFVKRHYAKKWVAH